VKKQQIVFINQSSGYLMIDIVHAFEKDYEQSILMTGFLNPRNRSLNTNVKVENLAKYDRTSSLKRILSWGLAFFKALYLIKWKYPKADLFLVSNPPMASLLPLFCSNPFSILIYDIYPDALLEFKIFKSDSAIIKYWKKANVKIYSRAERIYTLTEGMKNKLSQYVGAEKIKVVPIWTDNDFLKPIVKAENKFLKEQNLDDKFLIMYSGNLGKSHPIEILVDLANDLKDYKNLFFLIIGGGDKFELLKQKIKDFNLDNIRLLEWQPTEILPYTLSAADLAVVTLGVEATDLSIPSKTYNLMSVGVPILCIANKEAALSKLIEQHENGETFSSLQKEEIKSFILKCHSDSEYLESMKRKSLEASSYYTPENAKLFIDV
jgi:hypothetical protein